jgi:Zn-dependent protease/CBS domain-containing protein
MGIQMPDFSPTIGRIFGIKIELHWTFIMLLLFILIISFYLFIVWILLFVCVLIHELFHSLTSQRNGIKVSKIILYPFGGGSVIDFGKVGPDTEFRISIVGPISSLLLASVFGIMDIYAPSGILKNILQVLFLLNLFLGVFNLLPWLPLDGGRALRSFLQRKKSFIDATKISVRVSNVVSVLFVFGTLAYAAFFAPNSSLSYKEFVVIWDVAIAFFIYNGAQAELQSAFIKVNTSDLKVSDAMTKNFIVVKGNTRIRDLYKRLLKNKTNVVIFRKEEDIEVLSSVSLQKLLKGQGRNDMIYNYGFEIPKIEHEMNLYRAIELMRSEESNIAAVTKGSKIIGVLFMQHAESIIALHITQKKPQNKL